MVGEGRGGYIWERENNTNTPGAGWLHLAGGRWPRARDGGTFLHPQPPGAVITHDPHRGGWRVCQYCTKSGRSEDRGGGPEPLLRLTAPQGPSRAVTEGGQGSRVPRGRGPALRLGFEVRGEAARLPGVFGSPAPRPAPPRL